MIHNVKLNEAETEIIFSMIHLKYIYIYLQIKNIEGDFTLWVLQNPIKETFMQHVFIHLRITDDDFMLNRLVYHFRKLSQFY